MKQIAIIGAGPAGLMAAERLLAAGHAVTIYDQMPSVGRKFLMAGRGGLNLTHSEDLEQFLTRYSGADARLILAIRHFPPDALRQWCHDLGQETFVGSSGRVFPKTMKASPLLRQWFARLNNQGVVIKTRWVWQGWNAAGACRFYTPDGEKTIDADAFILAMGGASWARLGSDGLWAGGLSAIGVELAPFQPANGGFTVDWTPLFREKFAGQPLKNIAIDYHGQRVRGEAMVTATGIEGGAIYALSPILRAGLANGKPIIYVDLRPDMSVEAIKAQLQKPRRAQSLGNHLRRCLNLSAMNSHLLYEAGAVPDDLGALAARIKAVPVAITGIMGMERAISTAGGVRAANLDDRWMLSAHPGVFVAGEMLDWEAPTGGYLLQGCFATARAAADGAIAWLQEENKI